MSKLDVAMLIAIGFVSGGLVGNATKKDKSPGRATSCAWTDSGDWITRVTDGSVKRKVEHGYCSGGTMAWRITP